MPISHPSYYSTYLAKLIGPYSTLGLAEDTWALNEGVIDDDAFLTMTLDVEEERERMFWRGLDRLRRGSLVCVFDATDRVQHMFWRYTEADHPAVREQDAKHANAIEEMYVRNDKLVGRVLERLRKDDLLMVVSDHGMTSFRRGCNMNRWLLRERVSGPEGRDRRLFGMATRRGLGGDPRLRCGLDRDLSQYQGARGVRRRGAR